MFILRGLLAGVGGPAGDIEAGRLECRGELSASACLPDGGADQPVCAVSID